MHDVDLIEDETVQILKRRKLIEEYKTTSDIAQVVQNEEQQATEETTNSDQAIKTSTTDNDQIDLKKMIIADKKKLLWKKATPVEPKSNLMINQLATFGLRAKQPRDRDGLGSDEEKIQTGVEVTLRDPFMLTDKPYEQIKQKHLDKVLSAQIVIDAHDKDDLKEKLILFLNDERTYRLADTDVLKRSVRELQHIHYLLEVKFDITRRWLEYILKVIRDILRISGTKASQYIPMITEDDGREIPMLKNSAKVEVILKGRCLCYNEDSSHPRVIGDGLERTSIQALRTAIYQIGDSKDEELMQVKAQLVKVLRKAEDKLFSDLNKQEISVLTGISTYWKSELKVISELKVMSELKYDGQRAQIHKLGYGFVRVFSQNGDEITSRFPYLVNIIKESCSSEASSFVLDAEVSDISVKDYITASAAKNPIYMPHTSGRYQAKRFRKALCPLVERLTNSLMMHGRNNGKKLMDVCIVKHATEIIHLLTDQNPI
ncbi:hypothetical protein AgCh_038615 [Apium graveolens]